MAIEVLNRVPTLTPIISNEYPLAKVAGYYMWFGGEVAVQNADGNLNCTKGEETTNWVATTLKVASMVLSLGVLPLIAMLSLYAFRSMHDFQWEQAVPADVAFPAPVIQAVVPAAAEAPAGVNDHFVPGIWPELIGLRFQENGEPEPIIPAIVQGGVPAGAEHAQVPAELGLEVPNEEPAEDANDKLIRQLLEADLAAEEAPKIAPKIAPNAAPKNNALPPELDLARARLREQEIEAEIEIENLRVQQLEADLANINGDLAVIRGFIPADAVPLPKVNEVKEEEVAAAKAVESEVVKAAPDARDVARRNVWANRPVPKATPKVGVIADAAGVETPDPKANLPA